MRIIAAIICMCAFTLLGTHAYADCAHLEHPRDAGYVNDFAGVLTSVEKAGLEQDLRAFEHTQHAEFAVVTIKSLDGEPIFDCAHELFRKWGIGKHGADNGVLLLLSTGDREARIHVGTRLEPILTDTDSKQILHEVVGPAYKSGQPAKAIIDGAHAVITKLTPGLQTEGQDIMKHATPKPSATPVWIGIVLVGVAMFSAIILLILLAAIFRLIGRSERGADEDEDEDPNPQHNEHRVNSPVPFPSRSAPHHHDEEQGSRGIEAAVTGAIVEHEIDRPEQDREEPEERAEEPDRSEPEADSGVSFGGGTEEGGGAEEKF